MTDLERQAADALVQWRTASLQMATCEPKHFDAFFDLYVAAEGAMRTLAGQIIEARKEKQGE